MDVVGAAAAAVVEVEAVGFDSDLICSCKHICFHSWNNLLLKLATSEFSNLRNGLIADGILEDSIICGVTIQLVNLTRCWVKTATLLVLAADSRDSLIVLRSSVVICSTWIWFFF